MKPIAIRKVTFPDGHVNRALGRPTRFKVFPDGVTYEATKILEQNIKSGTGFPNATVIGCPAGGKTGTVDNFSDAWFVGFTPHLATAMWLGHAQSRIPMPGVAGGTIPAKIWGQYMKQARGTYCGDFPKPTTPFSSQPFFGRYATGRATIPNSPSTTAPGTVAPQQPPAQQPPASGPGGATATPGTGQDGTGGGQGGGNGGGGTQFPPDAYESPPQQTPGTDGGTGAATPAPG
jgi:penicillin-binding protein 1A